jgi:molecular chaperone DnaJ
MQLKDYYAILELKPSSTLQEIKQAYRRLAQQYHPDKNKNDAAATAHFTEIKEAYETLTHPTKKEQYLQQRWYFQSSGNKNYQEPITPYNFLKKVIELDKYVSTLDIHRMDKQGLFNYIDSLLNDEAIQKLNQFNDRETNKEIIIGLLKATHPLPVRSITLLIKKLSLIPADDATIIFLNQSLEYRNKINRWEKLRIWVVLAVVILVSLLIYFMSR